MTEHLPHYHWLASDDGAAELAAAQRMRADGLADLKIGEELRTRLRPQRAAMVLTQLDLRARAEAKFSRANELLFTREGLEQSTSEVIARYRSARYQDHDRILELCCGIGGDLIALGALGAPITAVDRDPVHLFLAAQNAHVYTPDAAINTLEANVEDVDVDPGAAVFIDPARREGSGRRLGHLSDPSIEWSLELASRSAGVGIKTAPGIPRELIPADWELELIALGNDLKEAVLWSPSMALSQRTATVVSEDATHTLTTVGGDTVSVRAPEPGGWLHDVNPAVTNAGLVEDLARTIEADRIDEEIGFLVSKGPIDHPMITSWQVLDVLPWHEKRLKQALASLGIGPIDIRRRGLPGDVPTITKRLRGKGDRRAIIAMTRVANEPTAIICSPN